MNSKLIKEIQTLIENDVISIEVANKIENYYHTKTPRQSNRLLTVFGVLGSLLVGLGIILVLAHNWDNFPRNIKTILAFIPLIIGQIVSGYALLKKKSKYWLESSAVFLFFGVGSSISLISQIYNIPGNFSTFLLSWMLLCIPLVYLLKSKGVFLLILVCSTVYACDIGYNFSGTKAIPWKYLLIIGILLPNYFKLLKEEKVKNVTSILNWLFPLSFIIVFGTFINSIYKYELIIYILFFGLIYNIGQLKTFQKIRLAKNGYLILGSLGIVISFLLASSKGFWNRNFGNSNIGTKEICISLILFLISIYILYNNKSTQKNDYKNLFQFSSPIIVFIYLTHFIDFSVAIVLMNCSVLALGISMIKRGADTLNFTFLNYGLLIITALIVTRFFDTNMTFVVRGFLFIMVGLGFFVSNYLMAKKMKSNI